MPAKPGTRGREISNRNLRNAPPAPRDNTRHLMHGGYARPNVLAVDGRTRALYDLLAEDAPLREAGELPRADRIRVELFALCLARLESVSAYVQMHGMLDAKGNERPATDLERRLRREAAEHADALGMSPRARVALGLQLTQAMSAQDTLHEYLRSRQGKAAGGD
jgi:hypothetical protein